jgi:SAM-dependent methyltransferase
VRKTNDEVKGSQKQQAQPKKNQEFHSTTYSISSSRRRIGAMALPLEKDETRDTDEKQSDQISIGRVRSDAEWAKHYAKAGTEARETLLAALERFESENSEISETSIAAETNYPSDFDHHHYDLKAVDLGCGGGRDTFELLRRGWVVLAIDAAATAVGTLRSALDSEKIRPAESRLTTKVTRFEDAEWSGPVDLVNSSFALPLCAKNDFMNVWRRIFQSLRVGGRFCGQLYGVRDQWNGNPTNTHLSRDEIDDLLTGFTVEMCREEEMDAVTPHGTNKHWHIFHIVARKS